MNNVEIDISVAKATKGIFPENPDRWNDTPEPWFYIKQGKLLIGIAYQINPKFLDGQIMYDRSWREWKPTEDMADAWYVVEAMEQMGYWAQLRTPFGLTQCNDGYWCGFTPHLASGWNGTPDNWTSAESQPLAICLAALATVEAAKED